MTTDPKISPPPRTSPSNTTKYPSVLLWRTKMFGTTWCKPFRRPVLHSNRHNIHSTWIKYSFRTSSERCRFSGRKCK